MSINAALRIRYWIATDHPQDSVDLDGVDEFKDELSNSYVTVVRGRSCGAGGITRLFVELISTFTVSHLVQLLIDGAAFDMIKSGTQEFALRP